MGRLDARVAVVTGAAQGIGAGIARGFAREGAMVAVLDLNLDGALKTAKSITDAGGQAIGLAVDVVDRGSVSRALDAVIDAFGKLDIIVNNAGFNRPQPFLEIDEKTWSAIQDVNALGVLLGMQEAAKRMVPQGSGKIVNTASIAGRSGDPRFAPYCASKAAVISLTQSAARALAGDGINVNAFAPGVVDTPLWEQLDKDLKDMGDDSGPDGAMAAMAGSIALGRVSTPDDIVGTAVFLASADSDYITGQVVVVDGGIVMQ